MRAAAAPVRLEFDDLIYALQSFGGASQYWREVTGRLAADQRFAVTLAPARKWLRLVPAFSRADVFHSSHFRTCPGTARNVATVHDLNYELGLVQGRLGVRVNLLERRSAYFTADALICISESTRKDLFSVYPRLEGKCPVFVIHHGVSIQRPASGTPRSALPGLGDAPYALYVGSRRAYKRFDTALEGFHQSGVWRDGVQLACTGSAFEPDELGRIRSLGLSEHVVAAGRCDEAQLAQLYAHAHCLLYTSSYEGFGLPVVEAMACGCPVVATRASSIPEVAGDAAVLVHPGDPGEVARAICLIQDPATRADWISRGLANAGRFSWDRSAQKHAELYLKVAAG